MSNPEIWLLLFAIGFVAGLRSVTPPAAVAWAAHLGWLSLHGTRLAFLGTTASVAIFTALAMLELITDQLPSTPNRTTAVPFSARIFMGCGCGAALSLAAGQPVLTGILLGAIGAVVGTFAGFYARREATSAIKIPFASGILEDLVAIGAAIFIVSRF